MAKRAKRGVMIVLTIIYGYEAEKMLCGFVVSTINIL